MIWPILAPLFEGEPAGGAGSDGGGAAVASPASPAAPAAGEVPAFPDSMKLPDEFGIDDPDPGQPDPSAQAAPPDGGSAAKPDGEPAKGEERDDQQLPPEVVKAIVSKHKDVAREVLDEDIDREIQAEVDAARADAAAAPQNDAEWQRFTGEAAGSFEYIAGVLDQFKKDGSMPAPEELSTHVARTTLWTQQAERRAHFVALEGLAQSMIDRIKTEGGKDLDPNIVAYSEQLLGEAQTEYKRFANAKNPQAQAAAWTRYLTKALPAFMNISLADGKRLGRKEAEEQFRTDLTYKQALGIREGMARAQAGMSVPDVTPQQAAPLTAQLIENMSDEEYEARRDEIMQFQRSALEGALS